MKQFWIILCLLVFSLPVLAQEDSAAAAFSRLEVSNVRLRLDEEAGTVALIFNANPPVCEPLITEVSLNGNVIDVDAYVPLSAVNATCNFIAPYEPVIELGELEADVTYAVLLNDFASTFFLPQVGGIVMDMPFAMLWGEDNALIPFSRVDAYINSLEISNSDGLVTLNVAGEHPDGCISQEFSWLRRDDVDANIYHLDIFRLIPQDVMCPMSLQEFSLNIPTELDANSSFYLEATDNWLSYAPESSEAIVYLPLTIDSVAVTSNGNAYDVAVTGSYSNCSAEPSEVLAERDYASFINLGFFLPLDGACSNETVAYSKTFSVGSLPVIVNGIAYNEDGILPVDASTIGGRPQNPVGDNFMQVDTVVESVDVLILESFPMQLDLVVRGYQPDGCEFPVIVEQSREGNLITVHIYRQVPPDVMCTMMLVPYEETIRLDGGFEGGSFEIRVNEFVTTVDL